MTVVDASAVIDLLAPPDVATRDALIVELPEPATPWLAPDILIFEVFAVVRRHTLRGVMTADLAARGLERLSRLPIELTPTMELLDQAWSLRDRFSAGDALYAALAMRSGEALLTTDLRLARAAESTGIDVRTA